MERFPKMLYRFPSTGVDTVALQDGSYDTLVAADEPAHDNALAAGWFETSPDARAAHEQPPATPVEAPASREALEAQATDLGIKFDGRTSDKKLRDLIAATLEA
jgi:hypothetical protein